MRLPLITWFFIAALVAGGGNSISAKAVDPLDPQRMDAIAAFLPEVPGGPGRPISDRSFWQEKATDAGFQTVIGPANGYSKASIPPIADELYLEFSRNGNRVNYERAAFGRRNRLTPLVLAECMTDSGKYLPAIEDLIKAMCAEKTWVLPAHDKKLTNFHGTSITIDLFSSHLAWQLAMADYLLADRLKPDTRHLVRREINRRVLDPFRAMIRGERGADWWLKGTNNWNPVCFSGVTGAALIEVPSAKDRAEFVAAAEHYSRYFLSGFTDDGYCSEGLAYWNYGFGTFAMMAQNFKAVTGGKLNLFQNPATENPAKFGARISIINGVVPAFADCPLNSQPSASLMWLLNREYQWQNDKYKQLDTGGTVTGLAEAMLYDEARREDQGTETSGTATRFTGGRSMFGDAGVYIFRPRTPTPSALGVAFKGGNNNEHHNHNDVGSYVVVRGDEAVLLDPGRETYTRRTFSPQRYDSKLLNSYGHPVPVVGGELQAKGKQAIGKVILEKLTETTDTVAIDMTSAYKLPELKRLVRTFEYGRGKEPVFVVTDEVEFATPQTFETALISLGKFRTDKEEPKTTQVKVDGSRSSVTVEVRSSHLIETAVDTIKEDAPVTPNRLAIRVREKVTSATVRMVIR